MCVLCICIYIYDIWLALSVYTAMYLYKCTDVWMLGPRSSTMMCPDPPRVVQASALLK